jgi:hypothetical protein
MDNIMQTCTRHLEKTTTMLPQLGMKLGHGNGDGPGDPKMKFENTHHAHEIRECESHTIVLATSSTAKQQSAIITCTNVLLHGALVYCIADLWGMRVLVLHENNKKSKLFCARIIIIEAISEKVAEKIKLCVIGHAEDNQ